MVGDEGRDSAGRGDITVAHGAKDITANADDNPSERYWIMPHPRPLVPPDASTLHYWHYACPDQDCAALVVRGGVGFTPQQVKELKT